LKFFLVLWSAQNTAMHDLRKLGGLDVNALWSMRANERQALHAPRTGRCVNAFHSHTLARGRPTKPSWHSIGNAHGNGMGPRCAVRIWVRAHQGATRPSVDEQSAPVVSHHPRHASARNPSTMNNSRLRCLTTWEVPVKG
jgi:hypothetical protein